MPKKIKKIKIKTIRLFANLASVVKPPPKLSMSEWADSNRRLSAESSAEHGQWRTDRAPYQRRIMDTISDEGIEIVIVMTSSQVGKTEMILNTIGYFVDHDPAPMMLLMPTLDLAQTFSKKRLAPMRRDTPCLRDKIKDPKAKNSDNTLLEKGFPGGYITMVGANSPSSLSSRPIRVLLADEVDRFPTSAGTEGDPLALAEKRTKTFWNRKKVYVSTPTEKGISRIEAEYEESSMEQWCLPCPACGRLQPLEWKQIKFNKEDIDGVTMECAYCFEQSLEREWKEGTGDWIAKYPENPKKGFHLNALASPWEDWATIVREFLKAKKDKELLKVFVNTYLGESWEEDEGEKMEDEQLFKRRERYHCEVPEGVLLLTAGVDVQDDRLEVEVVGWSHGFESWGIYYKVFIGDPGDTDVWNRLDDFLLRPFYYESGEGICIASVCVDSGGHYTTETYKFTKPRENRRVFSIKGVGGYGKPFIGTVTKNNNEKARLLSLGVDSGKEKIYSRLKVEFEGPKYCHFPIEDDRGYNEQYFKSLCSEKRVTRLHKGIKRFEWKKITKRNEGLDLRNYAMAAAEILDPDFEVLERASGDYYARPKGGTKKKRRKRSSGV